ncbi:MAG: DUF7680 family protein [Acidimicrobiia bacterium]
MKGTPRTFELAITPTADSDYTVDLIVSSNGRPERLTRMQDQHLRRMRSTLLAAIVSSKHARTALSPTRRAPIRLTEDAGVRLTLSALATRPLSKPSRVEEVRQAIDAMSSEEALYWYANCTGPKAARSLRALRIMLSEE